MVVTDAVRAAVLEAVDPAGVLGDLRALVAVPSTGGSDAEHEVQDVVARRLRRIGLDVDHWRLDLGAERAAEGHPGEEVERTEAWGCVGVLDGDARPGAARPALVLNGHLDVVPPGDPAAWGGRDPWTLTARDGVLLGRGSADMKGGVAAVLGAVEALRRAGVVLARPLAVHAVVGEEDGGLGAFATLRRGHTGDACVVAEPTAGALVVANSGALTFRLTVPGLAAHGSTRTAGVSALDALWPVLAALRALEADRHATALPGFEGWDLAAPLSVGTVRAGDWPSTVPDRLVAEGRYGVLPGEDVGRARAAFESAVAAACAEDPWLADHPVLVEWVGGQFAPGALDPGHPLADQAAAAVSGAGRPRPPRAGAPYGSDLRLYTAAGVPTLQLGPGDIRTAHSAEEHVDPDEVVAAARAYALLALARCA